MSATREQTEEASRVPVGLMVFARWTVTLCAVLLICGCKGKQETVVVYCAQDHVYALPLFQEFERATGIQVRPLFDSEAVKTVGLANRLLAERSRPRCDVFWGNEEMRTRQLAANGVFEEDGWAAFGYRSRRLVINTQALDVVQAPKSLLELTNKQWEGKVALAYPQFGTTGAHFLALRQYWGASGWTAWLERLAANRSILVDGNSVVVKTVGNRHAVVGLTDSDDVAVGVREGLPVAAVPPGSETLYIPNTVGRIRNSPNPENGKKLFEFLRAPETAAKLVQAGALEGAELPPAAGLEIDWSLLLRELDAATAELNRVFLK